MASSTPNGAASGQPSDQERLRVQTEVKVDAAKAKDQKVSYMNLPNKGQLAVLCLARMADPLATSSIQSYMFYQLKFFNPTASDATISTHAGLLVAARTAAQVCTGMFWGRLADSEWGGRKNVLIVGMLSSAIANVGYGMSRSLVTAIAWQVFSGALNSNIAMTRCIVAELNPEKRYRTRALLLLPLFANSGMLLGPLVGGLLSSQTSDGSNTGMGILHPYPFLLPNLFTASIYILAAFGVLFFLRETLEGYESSPGGLPGRIYRKAKSLLSSKSSHLHAYAPVSSTDDSYHEPVTPTSPESHQMSPSTPRTPTSLEQKKLKLPFRRIWTFNVICTMASHFIIAGHLGTFSNLWAIFLGAPVAPSTSQHPPLVFTGGLGLHPRDIGFAMSLLGAIGVILQMAVYPRLNDRFQTVSIWRAALYVFPVVYLAAPFPALVATATRGQGNHVLVWTSLSAVLFLYVLGRTGVTPATTLLINDCTPHPSVRGTIHTAGVVLGNLGRTVFPVAAFAIFGQGLRIGVVGLGFWCLAALAILACLASQLVREGSNGEDDVAGLVPQPVTPTQGQQSNGPADGNVTGASR